MIELVFVSQAIQIKCHFLGKTKLVVGSIIILTFKDDVNSLQQTFRFNCAFNHNFYIIQSLIKKLKKSIYFQM